MSQLDDELGELLRKLARGIIGNPLNSKEDYIYWIVKFVEELIGNDGLDYNDIIIEMLESEKDYNA